MKKGIYGVLLISSLLVSSMLHAAVSCQNFTGVFKGSLGNGALENFQLENEGGGEPFNIWFSFYDPDSGISGCPSRFQSCTETKDGGVEIVLGADNIIGFQSHFSAYMSDPDHLNVTSFQCIHNGIPYMNISGQGILSRS